MARLHGRGNRADIIFVARIPIHTVFLLRVEKVKIARSWRSPDDGSAIGFYRFVRGDGPLAM